VTLSILIRSRLTDYIKTIVARRVAIRWEMRPSRKRRSWHNRCRVMQQEKFSPSANILLMATNLLFKLPLVGTPTAE
jgi:hypothetical protein